MCPIVIYGKYFSFDIIHTEDRRNCAGAAAVVPVFNTLTERRRRPVEGEPPPPPPFPTFRAFPGTHAFNMAGPLKSTIFWCLEKDKGAIWGTCELQWYPFSLSGVPWFAKMTSKEADIRLIFFSFSDCVEGIMVSEETNFKLAVHLIGQKSNGYMWT